MEEEKFYEYDPSAHVPVVAMEGGANGNGKKAAKTQNIFIEPEIRMDNTKREAAKCKRKLQLAHMYGLKSRYGSTALRYGSTWHGFMEGYYGTIKELGWENRSQAISNALLLGKKKWDEATAKQEYYPDYRTLENASAAFLQYINHFVGDQSMLEVVGTEQTFSVILELTTDKEKAMFGHLPKVIFTGKIDLQVILNALKWIIEFKTTGWALQQAIARLNRSTQVIGYSYAAPLVLGFTPTGVLVSHHYLLSRKSAKTGEYGSVSIDFARTPQIFNEFDLQEWKMSFLNTAKELWDCYQKNYFPMNFDSCFDYGRQCAFYRLCTSGEDPTRYAEETPEGYIVDYWDVENEGGDE
jgi:hypothetical protein